MEIESCSTCGGDGRIMNAFGSYTSCPSCRGSGRRAPDEPTFRDVTKTKPSHHAAARQAAAVGKPKWPSTGEGDKLAKQVQESTLCTAEVKTRLIQEIIDYEASHGNCTQTFIKKIRKQVVPRAT
ncbi:MAG: molecular chaperone DnaJ [Myxococcales bacterium]|nr:molecular chaperone DnaJ [Myxococcales bacterium]